MCLTEVYSVFVRVDRRIKSCMFFWRELFDLRLREVNTQFVLSLDRAVQKSIVIGQVHDIEHLTPRIWHTLKNLKLHLVFVSPRPREFC